DILPDPMVRADDADGADDKIRDKSVGLAGSLVIRGRQIHVYRRRSWARKKLRDAAHGVEPHETISTGRWYDGDAGQIRGEQEDLLLAKATTQSQEKPTLRAAGSGQEIELPTSQPS